ncbi:MAG TPA: hypothetical protein PLO44_00400 [Candidatus Paceibacterota bacterium]|nr:hypothetical protein [Candidatus Paceibacterota bacterium]
MDKKKLFIRLATVILFIFFLNFIGSKFYWYYSVWYFDIIMHTLGGFWVALAALWIFPTKEQKITYKYIIQILLIVLTIGIFWEFFEIFVNETIAQNPFNILDTVSDIFCDLAGGTFATIYFVKRIFIKEENKL